MPPLNLKDSLYGRKPSRKGDEDWRSLDLENIQRKLVLSHDDFVFRIARPVSILG